MRSTLVALVVSALVVLATTALVALGGGVATETQAKVTVRLSPKSVLTGKTVVIMASVTPRDARCQAGATSPKGQPRSFTTKRGTRGRIVWRWRVPRSAQPGRWIVRVTCPGNVKATAPLRVLQPLPPTPIEPLPKTTIEVRNRTWRCDGPLSELGPLPILVEQTWDNAASEADSVKDGVWLNAGCTGDGDRSTIDLILHINGNGADIGTADDGMTVRPGAHDIEIAGFVNCGGRHEGAHQDAVQVNDGARLTFMDFRSGDVTRGTWTCHGSGGLFYVAGNSGGSGATPTEVLCIRCRMVGSNQGLRVDWSVRSGARDSTFASRLPCRVNLKGDAREVVDLNNTCIDTD